MRDLKGVGEIPGQREWTDAMAALLLEAQDKAGQARERGSRHIGTVARRRISERYDEIVTQAIRANPDPLLRGRVSCQLPMSEASAPGAAGTPTTGNWPRRSG